MTKLLQAQKSAYVLQSGKHQGSELDSKTGQRVVYTKGDTVWLTPQQAHSFRDKFVPVEVVAAQAEVAIAQARAAKKVADARPESNKAAAKTELEPELERSESSPADAPAVDASGAAGAEAVGQAASKSHAASPQTNQTGKVSPNQSTSGK